MKRKAVFLDRDGTINIDYGYVYEPEKFHFITGSIQALKVLQDNGYLLIIITNQSGIGRGYYTCADFLKLHRYIDQILEKFGVKIDGLFYCPHTEEDHCECRKPKTKLFYEAADRFEIDFSKSYAVGDSIRDLSVCSVEPTKGILLSDKDFENKTNYKVCNNLFSAAQLIVSEKY